MNIQNQAPLWISQSGPVQGSEPVAVEPNAPVESSPSTETQASQTTETLELQALGAAALEPNSLNFLDDLRSPEYQAALEIVEQHGSLALIPGAYEKADAMAEKLKALTAKMPIHELEELKHLLSQNQAREAAADAAEGGLRTGGLPMTSRYLSVVSEALDQQILSPQAKKADALAKDKRVAVSPEGLKQGEARIQSFKNTLKAMSPNELQRLKGRLEQDLRSEAQSNLQADTHFGTTSLNSEYLAAVQAELAHISQNNNLSRIYDLAENNAIVGVSPDGFAQAERLNNEFQTLLESLSHSELQRLRNTLAHQLSVESASTPDNPMLQRTGATSLTGGYLQRVQSALQQ